MNKKELNQISNKLHNKLIEQTKAMLFDFDEEVIHKLRVTHKKLRAFLRMLSHQKVKENSIIISNKLKASFKLAGSIRDIQIQQQRILKAVKNREIKKPTMYLFLLQKEMALQKEKLLKILTTKIIAANSKHTTAALPNRFSIKLFRGFLLQHWKNIDAILLSKKLSDDDIHSIRKSIKDILYNLKIYEKTKHGMLTNSIWKGKDEAYFSALLTELGQFQDRFTGILFLNAKRINKLDKHSKAQINTIKKIWQKEKSTLKKTLLLRLKNDFTIV